MNKEQIKNVITNVISVSKQETDALKKMTVRDSFHIGGLSGNRLNSGTLRSQFIFCEKESDWTNSSKESKNSLYQDQMTFVQVGSDIWDVYTGGGLTGGEEPVKIYNNQEGLLNLLKKIRKEVSKSQNNNLKQVIYYGCPGSGKSFHVKEITENVDSNFVFRTTFHPDTDYASFVGCYKPVSNSGNATTRLDYTIDDLASILKKNYEDADIKTLALHSFALEYADYFNGKIANYNKKDLVKKADLSEDYPVEINKIVNLFGWMKDNGYVSTNDSISYRFRPQVFTNAYIKAWEDTSKPVYLIIEEINRGNCAQIFGDLFQLLDRDSKTGKSEYSIKADKDLVAYIESCLGAGHEGIRNGELCLPSNLIIYATMNTSDQSLFPMDSAFKRRWTWKYVPIDYTSGNSSKFIITIGGEKYKWVDFLKEVNSKIIKITSSEDKQMGNYFIKDNVDEEEFVNKVMFYLWSEVCKDEYQTGRNIFYYNNVKDDIEFSFTDLFDPEKNKTDILKGFMKKLDVKSINDSPNKTTTLFDEPTEN